MIVHMRETKVNFVDENNVLVGFDITAICCEYVGWFIAHKVCEEVIKETPMPDIVGFNFDTNFFAKNKKYGGGIIIFRLTDRENNELFLHLYNIHNGFYTHGFEVTVNGITIRDAGV